MVSSTANQSAANDTHSASAEAGWRHARVMPSLPEVFSSVRVPATGGFWRKMLAFADEVRVPRTNVIVDVDALSLL